MGGFTQYSQNEEDSVCTYRTTRGFSGVFSPQCKRSVPKGTTGASRLTTVMLLEDNGLFGHGGGVNLLLMTNLKSDINYFFATDMQIPELINWLYEPLLQKSFYMALYHCDSRFTKWNSKIFNNIFARKHRMEATTLQLLDVFIVLAVSLLKVKQF